MGDAPADDEQDRLQRCIRDLVALHALPSMCVGRSLADSLAIIVEALPPVLQCNLVCIAFPSIAHGSMDGVPLTTAELEEIAFGGHVDGADVALTWRDRTLWCIQLDVPIGDQSARFIAGKTSPLDAKTDRVLFRTAANLVGTTLQTAHVLEAARRKDDFIAMLGHELRNPLASILTAVEILGRHTAPTRERDVIEMHTRHLSRLVDDLLDVTRITRGHIELRREPVTLHSILERAVEVAMPLVRRSSQTLTRHGNEELILDGDVVRLTQVFGNLLTNASKFTPSGGTIDIHVSARDGRACVAIRDSGRGIARENVDRIFEAFVQVDRSHEVPTQGLGLGLAVVRMLVERHGGTISAASEGLGRGSTFRVELPIAEHITEVPAAIPRPSRPPPRSGTRVLVVDDSPDIADLLVIALSAEGYEAIAEYEGRAALQRWQTFQPHAAVLDVGMPGIDGYQLANAIRNEHGATPTLIAATGYGQPEDRKRALDAGFDIHVVKPVSIDDLIALLDERVAKRSS